MRQEIRKLAVAAILLGGVATFGVSAPAWSEDAPAQASATGSEQPQEQAAPQAASKLQKLSNLNMVFAVAGMYADKCFNISSMKQKYQHYDENQRIVLDYYAQVLREENKDMSYREAVTIARNQTQSGSEALVTLLKKQGCKTDKTTALQAHVRRFGQMTPRYFMTYLKDEGLKPGS